MKWLTCEPTCGSMIRVQAGSVLHYGVFVCPDEVIQFGVAPNRRADTPGSPAPGILQARILEWVAISFSNA